MHPYHQEMLATVEACSLYSGSTRDGAIYFVWELHWKASQRRGLLNWDLNAPTRKRCFWQRREGAFIGELVKGGRPYSLSWFGLDVLQTGLSFCSGLSSEEGPSVFSPAECAQGCVFIPEPANPCLLVAHL